MTDKEVAQKVPDAPDQVDWQLAGALMEAHYAQRAAGNSTGTSNWGAALARVAVKHFAAQPVQPALMFVQERAQLEQEWCELQHLKAAYKLPQPVQPVQPTTATVDTSKVICPACCHQFRAIPQDVQTLMLDAGFEPPFTEPAPVAQAEPTERQYVSPVQIVADLVNNLLMLDQALPIYGAQYIDHPTRGRCAVAVDPTVSRERVLDSRWIGRGDTLNAAVIWTRATQPAVIKDEDGRDAERYRFLKSEAYEVIIPHGSSINGCRTAWITKLHPGGNFDVAIDAAIQAKDATP